jgi:hypothetical protein
VDCVRQRRQAPGGVAAAAAILIMALAQHDCAAVVAEVIALGDVAAAPLLALAADGDSDDSLAGVMALTIFLTGAPALAARCAACPAAVGAAARHILGTGVGLTDLGDVALSFLAAAASPEGGVVDALAAQPQVVKAAVRAVAGAAEAVVVFNAMRLLQQILTARPADAARELLRVPGALAALVQQLSPPAEARTRCRAAAALCMAVECDEAVAREALQLGAMDPLVALLIQCGSKDGPIGVSDETTNAAWCTSILVGLHLLVRAASDGGSSFARAVYPAPGGFARALTAVASQRGLPACSAALSLLCALCSRSSAGPLHLLAARSPDLVAGAAKALCRLLEGALVDDLSAAQLCCPVYGLCPHILHTFGLIAIPEAGDLSTAFASAAWVPQVIAALQAAVTEPPTAASSADADMARAQQQGPEACGLAQCPARQEMRLAAAELLQRLQAALHAAAAAEQQQQQQQHGDPRQQQQQQVRPSPPHAGTPESPPAAGAAAAAEQCAECGAGGRLRLCRGCRAVRYCGEECARRAWKGGHRAKCLAAQAARQQAGQRPSGQQLKLQS